MYPLGLLFGLGFDTATEIGLLGISATEAARGASLAHVLVFPALFAAGMALVDTADSALMVSAYRWAFVDPYRKLWYNLTITVRLDRGRAVHRRHRGAGAHRRPARPVRRAVVTGRGRQRLARQFRLRRDRAVRARLARLGRALSPYRSGRPAAHGRS
ncbi:hypothetical protein ACVI1J_002402 [Bradyrhizobium diazoefficiens]